MPSNLHSSKLFVDNVEQLVVAYGLQRRFVAGKQIPICALSVKFRQKTLEDRIVNP